MKIKLCVHGREHIPNTPYDIITTKLYLKTWYDIHGSNPNTEWLKGGYWLFSDNYDQIAESILSEKPNIVGFGCYVWNFEQQIEIARRIKLGNPNATIVFGGPQLSVHTDIDGYEDVQKDFFINNPFVDYVVYGEGEKPFQQIIDFESGYLENTDSFINIVKNNNGVRQLFPYERITDPVFLGTSIFLENKDYFLEEIKLLEQQGIPRKKQSWSVEYARGCMYKCTFCDWSQNLTKKVSRKKHSWKDEIDLFCSVGISARVVDANFGQWPQDIEIFDYAISKYKDNKNFIFIVNNTSKLNKERTQYLNLKTLQTYGINSGARPKISIQDVHDDILENIDRPSVSIEKIEEMIKFFRENLSYQDFLQIKTEIILGLPGQTYDHIKNMLKELYRIGLRHNVLFYDWFMLPNSPAVDSTYRKIWKIKTKKTYYRKTSENMTDLKFSSLQHVYQSIAEKQNLNLWIKGDVIYSTKHLTYLELTAARILVRKLMKVLLWRESDGKEKREPTYNEYCKLVDSFSLKSIDEAREQIDNTKEFINLYNFVVYGRWDSTEKKLYAFY